MVAGIASEGQAVGGHSRPRASNKLPGSSAEPAPTGGLSEAVGGLRRWLAPRDTLSTACPIGHCVPRAARVVCEQYGQ